MATAIIYARVSSAKQAEDGLPIEGQLEQCRQKAALLGASVLHEFVDAGISGRTDERPAFQSAMSYCSLHAVDHFITWSTSRFARNKLDAALYKRELSKCGTRLAYVSVDIDSSTDAGWMMESMLEIFDEVYSRQVSADTRRSMLKNASDGYWNGGRAPFGYRVVEHGKRKKLAIDEVESISVRMIYRLALSGIGAREIARKLNADGITRRGKAWAKSTVAYLLASPIYAGFIVFNRVGADKVPRPISEWIMTKSHQAIIEKDEWDSLQDQIQARAPERDSGSAKSTFAFTGMLKCGVCGSPMQIESATGRSRTYSYYNCAKWLRGGHCSSRRIRADLLDEWLEKSILDAILTRPILEKIVAEMEAVAGKWAREQREKIKAVESELRDVDRRYGRLIEVLELHGKDAPNLSDLSERMRELNARRKLLKDEAQRLESMPEPTLSISSAQLADAEDLVRAVIDRCHDASKRRAFYSGFVREIVLEAESAKVEYKPTALVATMTAQEADHSGQYWLPDRGSLRTAFMVFSLPARWAKLAA